MQCAHHPEVLAVETCSRCGAFVCGDCLELLGEEPFCAHCYGRRDVTGAGSTRAVLALIFSSTGLLCGAPFGVVGLILAALEAGAIQRGTAPLSSRSYVKVAKILGWVSIGLTTLAALAFAAFVWLVSRQLPPR